MSKLTRIEKEYQLLLPEVYKEFYQLCSVSIPHNLVGTSLLNNYAYADLKNGAEELLEEYGVDNFLKSDDFIFMMHQGYLFWYFKADGHHDPTVFGYYEGKLKPDSFGRFSEFVKQYHV